ncbi:MAG: glycoside hydrolase family 92 protein [Clostridia bacterium]|nr:glycoside hydrolase family 92 protein [Clostridia bacterium]
MKDFCKYVNVFQGTGEIDLPKPEGIAARWFFIKAGCGNTSPAACLPFSAMSVSPFSGAYPTGYGDHMPNSFARPVHFPEGKGLLGFAHLQQSGTGSIGFYYNYAVVTPGYEGSAPRRVPGEETAEPGYYRTTLEDIVCELTVSGRTALHRYTFGHGGGRVRVNFENNGVDIPNWGKAYVYDLKLEQLDETAVAAEATIEGIKVFFAVRANAPLTVDGGCAYLNAPESGVAELAVSISPLDAETARSRIQIEYDFDAARKAAYEIWNSELGRIDIETDDDRVREIFYSNLYHSLVKPADWSDESFVYGKGPFVIDLATLWDIYKTQLPLIYMTNRELGEKLNETLLRLCENLGFMPNGLGISDGYRMFNDQARMLGFYALFTAYRYGYPTDVKRLLENFKRDFFDEGKKDFTQQGRCGSHTFFLDMTEICTLAADIAKENGDGETEALLRPYGQRWPQVYDKQTGLLDADSGYYEGTLYNYSFRQMADMPARIALAGGNERFVKLLDDFFGYGKPETTQPTDPHDEDIVREGMKLGRFEGFNNESDTEAPFSYIYAGRQDRTCEVIRAGMKYMFTTGRGGLPGNNDSGALSSYYVTAALGLFPVAGQDLFLIGSPFVKSAKIALFNGRTLEIAVDKVSDRDIYVKSVKFNGKELTGYKISAGELMAGGRLEFCMCDKF